MIEVLKEKFRIVRKIGAGGMAEIYLAVNKETNEQVAIKILHPEQRNNIIHKKRFLSEIKLTKKIDSPYVVKIKDYVWEEHIQYIVMDYIDGDILKDYVSKRTRLTVDEAVEFSKELALGLEEIHANGIVHRDVKASNIMVSEHGQIVIIDFGIAVNGESERLTRTDNVIGSVQYIAPEILEQKPITKLSDIYALGIIMFEMLTGTVPFTGKGVLETAMKHKNEEVPHVNKLFPNIPQSLANIVIKATAKNMSERYKSMFELYKDLDVCLSNEKALEQPLILSNKKQKKSIVGLVNSKWFFITLGALLVAGLMLIIVLLAVK